MTDVPRRDWVAEARDYRMTCVYEHALRAAAGVNWQQLCRITAGDAEGAVHDYFDTARVIISEYLRHTGRLDEAAEVSAAGSSALPPATSFARLTPSQLTELGRHMQG